MKVKCIKCGKENKELRECSLCGRSLCSHCVVESWGEFHYCVDCKTVYSSLLTNQTPENYVKLEKLVGEKEKGRESNGT